MISSNWQNIVKYIKSYKAFDEFFVETNTYQQVEQIFQKYGVAIWTGSSGCGKTIGAIHLILKQSTGWIFRRIRSWKELRYIEKDKKTIIIPHATSCGGYTVFDLSVSQSVSPDFLVSETLLKPLNTIS